MSAHQNFQELPWYETLRTILEPYQPVSNNKDADERFTSTEIISSIESHHGVPQGVVGKKIEVLVHWDEFVGVMHYLGYREVNASTGIQLEWLMRRKKPKE